MFHPVLAIFQNYFAKTSLFFVLSKSLFMMKSIQWFLPKKKFNSI
jgi:hypothetical protein